MIWAQPFTPNGRLAILAAEPLYTDIVPPETSHTAFAERVNVTALQHYKDPRTTCTRCIRGVVLTMLEWCGA